MTETAERAAALELFNSTPNAVGVQASGTRATRGAPGTQSTRRRDGGDVSKSDPGVIPMTLVQGSDGLYDWRFGGAATHGGATTRGGALRGYRDDSVFAEQAIANKALDVVSGSMVSTFLEQRDKGFNPRYGLFDAAGQRVDRIVDRGRVLLIVHGTFSNCTAILDQFLRHDAKLGRSPGSYLSALGQGYEQVLLFEHPTLQVAPWINALDLSRAFAGKDVQIDVICHSRGGLVTRWWLEVLSRPLLAHARVVFVGAPLMGTGLASPHRLRTAMKLFTNYAIALQHASGMAALAVPVFGFAEVLAGIVGSATSVLSKAPVADSLIAAIPGLASMSRYGEDGSQFISGNVELAKLEYGWAAAPSGYFAVQSNFEPQAVGWRFWRAFRKPVERIANVGTDAIFSGANDLVVDTASMTTLTQKVKLAGPGRVHDFSTSETVHHTNYFEQAETLDFIAKTLAR